MIIDFIYSQARVCNTQGKGIKGIKPEVCGKYQTCRAHTKRQRNYLRFLYSNRRCAQGLRDLPHTSAKCHRKCGENPRSADQAPVLAFSDLRFCSQIGIVLCGFRFFPALPENEALYRVFQRQWRHPRQHPGAAETLKGHCRNTEQRPFFVIASRRVRDASLRESYRNDQQPNRAMIRNTVGRPQIPSKLN